VIPVQDSICVFKVLTSFVVVSTSAFLSIDYSNTVDREGHQGFLIPRAPAHGQHMAKLQHGAFCKLSALATYRVEQMMVETCLHKVRMLTTRQPEICMFWWD